MEAKNVRSLLFAQGLALLVGFFCIIAGQSMMADTTSNTPLLHEGISAHWAEAACIILALIAFGVAGTIRGRIRRAIRNEDQGFPLGENVDRNVA